MNSDEIPPRTTESRQPCSGKFAYWCGGMAWRGAHRLALTRPPFCVCAHPGLVLPDDKLCSTIYCYVGSIVLTSRKQTHFIGLERLVFCRLLAPLILNFSDVPLNHFVYLRTLSLLTLYFCCSRQPLPEAESISEPERRGGEEAASQVVGVQRSEGEEQTKGVFGQRVRQHDHQGGEKCREHSRHGRHRHCNISLVRRGSRW